MNKKDYRIPSDAQIAKQVFKQVYKLPKGLENTKKTITNKEYGELLKLYIKEMKKEEMSFEDYFIIEAKNPLLLEPYIMPTDSQLKGMEEIKERCGKDPYLLKHKEYVTKIDKRASIIYNEYRNINNIKGLLYGLFLEGEKAKNIMSKLFEGRTLEAKDITLTEAYALQSLFEDSNKALKQIIIEKEKKIGDK